MCGRYTTNTEEELIEIREILNDISIRITEEEKSCLDKEVTPGQKAPVITKEKEIRVVKWGFVKWDNKGLIFNARSESVDSSNYFKRYLASGRCVIPGSNYFEWEHVDKEKIKYVISEDNKDILYFAGIIKDEDDGTKSYCIITKEAQNDIKFIHSRMPYILEPNEIEDWLDGKLMPNDLKDDVSLTYNKCK